jgi:hypothetical protein
MLRSGHDDIGNSSVAGNDEGDSFGKGDTALGKDGSELVRNSRNAFGNVSDCVVAGFATGVSDEAPAATT